MENFEKEILAKIDGGRLLSGKEIRDLVYEFEVECKKGDLGRWTQSRTSIVEIDGRYFKIEWEKGSTEYQEDEFYNQPVEVKRKVYEKVVEVVEWVPVSEVKRNGNV